jgi:hypothetical protein
MTEASRARYLSANTTSFEIRERLASAHALMTEAEDVLREAEDHGERLSDEDVASAKAGYEDLCEYYGAELVTDASGLFLRCAETGIPLVIGDEIEELKNGEMIIVRRAA